MANPNRTRASASTASLVSHVLITVRSLVKPNSSRTYHSAMDTMVCDILSVSDIHSIEHRSQLILLPYVPTVVMIALSSLIGAQDPGTVHRDPYAMYCHMEADPPCVKTRIPLRSIIDRFRSMQWQSFCSAHSCFHHHFCDTGNRDLH